MMLIFMASNYLFMFHYLDHAMVLFILD